MELRKKEGEVKWLGRQNRENCNNRRDPTDSSLKDKLNRNPCEMHKR
jgi:hypothetical protein